MSYQQLIESKVVTAHSTGFDIDPATLHPSLFPHQRDIIAWNVQGGSRAVFASFGLGKTRIASVPYTAVKMDRYGIGTELNADYWRDGCAYLREAEAKRNVPTLFDVFQTEEIAA